MTIMEIMKKGKEVRSNANRGILPLGGREANMTDVKDWFDKIIIFFRENSIDTRSSRILKEKFNEITTPSIELSLFNDLESYFRSTIEEMREQYQITSD